MACNDWPEELVRQHSSQMTIPALTLKAYMTYSWVQRAIRYYKLHQKSFVSNVDPGQIRNDFARLKENLHSIVVL